MAEDEEYELLPRHEVENLKKEIQELRGKRRGPLRKVEIELGKLYERIVEAKENRLAIVPVVNSCCQGCFMSITPQQLNLLMGQQEIVTCGHCGRILYLRRD